MEFVSLGKIVNTFGIKGELKIESYTDFASDRFKKDSTIYIGEEYEPMQVSSFRIHKGFILIKLVDHEDINLVEKFKNKYVYKAKQDIKPLENGEYYFSDLRGLDVYIDDNKVGKVIRVEEGLANNNLRVLKDGKEYLIPYVKAFILNVDLQANRIDIRNVEGLFWK